VTDVLSSGSGGLSLILSSCVAGAAVGQTTRPQVFTRNPCPVPASTDQPCGVLSACGCNEYNLCLVALDENYQGRNRVMVL